MQEEEEDLAKLYQQKSDKEHILSNPDTYIGSVESTISDEWVLESGKIVKKTVSVNTGLLKLFDEGIVNCRDHWVRMKNCTTEGCHKVTKINVHICPTTGLITLENDGNGIDVVKHPQYDIWIPELIFGHLRTSTNYNKDEKKIVGGKNGFGFKLVLIWSTFGSIETVDHVRGLKYVQEFSNNLTTIGKAKITPYSGKNPYTKVSFLPDYSKLGIEMSPEILSLYEKRVYDIAAVTDSSVKIKYNAALIPIKTFVNYMDLYIGEKKRVYESNGPRWEYAVTTWSEFCQVSFVNGVCTSKGGKHVEYILNQIVRKLCAFIEKKKKIQVNASTIKEQLFLFIRCDVENPSFDSQTKDFLTTPSTKFGSTATVTDSFIEKIAKLGIVDKACEISAIRDTKLAKKTDGSKSKSIRGIPKLLDANWAGTEKSKLCVLIFCEGDSAKAGIVSGLSSDDRNVIGVYPMKGKMLNVRGESVTKLSENKEIIEIKKILGLETGKEYNTLQDVHKNLRYSKIVYMTDQDLDGSHIKGLGINFFHSEWPSLLKIPNFISYMNTPILKAKRGTQTICFYNEQEYELWKQQHSEERWNVKYYKGLGTSTAAEFREYFANKRFIDYIYTSETSDEAIDMVFNKKRAQSRKDWLSQYSRNFVASASTSLRYEDFFNLEMIHFSKYDCERNIPNLMDGLKTSLRKILFSAFKKKLFQEIKVAQFSGYVSEVSGYHHGEASLNAAIIGMAQTFVGSNNINLLMPNGQMGTRLRGGEDSASERYIFTQLSKITRFIFVEDDDNILDYVNDDGCQVEPIYYAPIIPMVLVNGSKGIGTGFSTDIMNYNPTEIIAYIKSKLQRAESSPSFLPFYKGFRGTIERLPDDRILIKGSFKFVGSEKIKVYELPVGTWTYDFKELLEKLLSSSLIKDYSDMSTDVVVDFTVTFPKDFVMDEEDIRKMLKLNTIRSTTNMHLFDSEERLVKYANVKEIIDAFYEHRYQLYEKRKTYLLAKIFEDLKVARNKMRYLEQVLDGSLDLRNKKRQEIIDMLLAKDFDSRGEDGFNYLIKMPMDMVSEENVEKSLNLQRSLEIEHETLLSKSVEQIWYDELVALEKQL